MSPQPPTCSPGGGPRVAHGSFPGGHARRGLLEQLGDLVQVLREKRDGALLRRLEQHEEGVALAGRVGFLFRDGARAGGLDAFTSGSPAAQFDTRLSPDGEPFAAPFRLARGRLVASSRSF